MNPLRRPPQPASGSDVLSATIDNPSGSYLVLSSSLAARPTPSFPLSFSPSLFAFPPSSPSSSRRLLLRFFALYVSLSLSLFPICSSTRLFPQAPESRSLLGSFLDRAPPRIFRLRSRWRRKSWDENIKRFNYGWMDVG